MIKICRQQNVLEPREDWGLETEQLLGDDLSTQRLQGGVKGKGRLSAGWVPSASSPCREDEQGGQGLFHGAFLVSLGFKMWWHSADGATGSYRCCFRTGGS